MVRVYEYGKCYFVFLLVCNQTLIIYMEKLHDSDWLRTVQFKCNTVQITYHISGLSLAEKPMISGNMVRHFVQKL